jgi:hypothetical protein
MIAGCKLAAARFTGSFRGDLGTGISSPDTLAE